MAKIVILIRHTLPVTKKKPLTLLFAFSLGLLAAIPVAAQTTPPNPVIHSFTASPASITAGESSTLVFRASNVIQVTISEAGCNWKYDKLQENAAQSCAVAPTSTTTYKMTATGADGTNPASKSVTVTVVPPADPPVIHSFTSSPASITAGKSVTLRWRTSNAVSLTIEGGDNKWVGLQRPSGELRTGFLYETTKFTLTAMGVVGVRSATRSVTVEVAQPDPPVIHSFTALPASITAGDTSTLEWRTSNTSSVTISDGTDSWSVMPSSNSDVHPTQSTTYTLIAKGLAQTGSVSANVTVNVDPVTDVSTGNELHFAHFGEGENLTSDIILLNPSEEDFNSGEVRFFNPDGKNMNDSLGFTAEQVQFTLSPRGSMVISPEVEDGLVTGSVVVTSQGPLSGFIRFRIDGLGMTGVGSSNPASRVIIPVQGGDIRTGVAIRNIEEGEVSVMLFLISPDGAVVQSSDPISIPGQGQIARFIDEYFPEVGSEFQGSVKIESPEGEITVVALELGSRAGEFATLPVGE